MLLVFSTKLTWWLIILQRSAELGSRWQWQLSRDEWGYLSSVDNLSQCDRVSDRVRARRLLSLTLQNNQWQHLQAPSGWCTRGEGQRGLQTDLWRSPWENQLSGCLPHQLWRSFVIKTILTLNPVCLRSGVQSDQCGAQRPLLLRPLSGDQRGHRPRVWHVSPGPVCPGERPWLSVKPMINMILTIRPAARLARCTLWTPPGSPRGVELTMKWTM